MARAPRPPAARQGQGAKGRASRGAIVCPDRCLLGRVAKAGRHCRPRARISRPYRHSYRRDVGCAWDEVDMGAKLWTIPADRMKAGKEHRVPLSDAALAVLRQMHAIRHGDYVFPGGRDRRPLSEMSLLID